MFGNVWYMWVVWLAMVGVGIAGLATVWRGLFHDPLRGRRRCPKCWYDLSGTTASMTCSECGYVADDERALSRTRRRWRLAAFGLLMVLAAAFAVVRTLPSIQSMKPVWLLAIEMKIDGHRGWRAQWELLLRSRNGQLTQEQVSRLADEILALQAGADDEPHHMMRGQPRHWSVLGRIVEEAWIRGDLTEEQCLAYIRNAFESNMRVDVPTTVSIGEPIRVSIATGWPRVSDGWYFPPYRPAVMVFVAPLAIIGAEPMTKEDGDGVFAMGETTLRAAIVKELWLAPINEPGVHEFSIELDVAIVPQFVEPYPTRRPVTSDAFDAAIVRWIRTDSFEIEVSSVSPARHVEP